MNNNQEATFECFVTGSNSSLTVTWERNRKHYNGIIKNMVNNNEVSSSLTINTATVRDSGKYRCNATNADGNSTVSAEAILLSNFL